MPGMPDDEREIIMDYDKYIRISSAVAEQTAGVKVGGMLWHGSPHKLGELCPHASPGEYGPSVFLTPLKGIASIFIIDNNDVNGPGTVNSNCSSIYMDYKEWRWSDGQLQDPLKTVHILVNTPEWISCSGMSSGYLHGVRVTEEILRNLKTYVTEDPSRELVYSGEPIPVDVVEPVSVEWTCEYSPEMEREFGN